MGRYDDLLKCSRPVSKKHPPMPRANRAAQFAPFAALSGYDAAILEAGRQTEQRIILSEDAKRALDQKQRILMEHIAEHPVVSVTCFVPDSRKSGGAYRCKEGRLKRIDETARLLIFMDGTELSCDAVTQLDSPYLEGLSWE